jgi:hypothetical protein
MVPNLPAKPSDLSLGRRYQINGMPRGEAGENSCNAVPEATDPGQLRFDLKTHISKLLKTKKAASS